MEETQKIYEIEFTKRFQEGILAHQKTGLKSILIKISILIDELREHPTTGTGKPEPLKGDRKGQWSRRISQEHRLIYEIQEDIITIVLLSSYGHYGDK